MSKTQWAMAEAIPDVDTPPAAKAAAKQGEDKPNLPPPEARLVGALVTPVDGDPNELLKFRFLCRGGALLIVGPAGVGKSTLAMQAALCWAIERDFFGIVPARPLRSLMIQSENDEGDLAEMRDGVLAGLGARGHRGRAHCAGLLRPGRRAAAGETSARPIVD